MRRACAARAPPHSDLRRVRRGDRAARRRSFPYSEAYEWRDAKRERLSRPAHTGRMMRMEVGPMIRPPGTRGDARVILAERFARGDIDEAEYRTKLALLGA